jgi:drug/metabolite transporter (DMT)-like permease
VLPALLTTFLFAISVACANQSAKALGGAEANFWRLAIATFLLGLWAHVFGQGLSGVSFALFLWSGIIGVGADVFLFQALPLLGSRLTLLILQCGSALVAASVEWIWLGTHLTGWQVAGCAAILAGVTIALAPGKHLALSRHQLLAGTAFSLCAALGNGMGAVLSRKAYTVAAAAGQNIDGATGGYQRLIGGLLVAGIFLLVVKRDAIAARFAKRAAPLVANAGKWRRGLPWVAANAVAGQTLGVTCYQWALKTTPTALVLAIVATAPLVVIPFARLWERERIELRSVLGGILAVIGAIILVLTRQQG